MFMMLAPGPRRHNKRNGAFAPENVKGTCRRSRPTAPPRSGFKLTASGKVKHRKAFRSHILTNKAAQAQAPAAQGRLRGFDERARSRGSAPTCKTAFIPPPGAVTAASFPARHVPGDRGPSGPSREDHRNKEKSMAQHQTLSTVASPAQKDPQAGQGLHRRPPQPHAHAPPRPLHRAWAFAFRDRKWRKRVFRRLWIARISAAAKTNGISLQPPHQRPQEGRRGNQPQDAERNRRAPSRRTSPAWSTGPRQRVGAGSLPTAVGESFHERSIAGIVRRGPRRIAAAGTSPRSGEVQVRYLGRKGELTAALRGMGSLAPEERPAMGQAANEVKAAIEAAVAAREAALAGAERASRFAARGARRHPARPRALPGRAPPADRRHPRRSSTSSAASASTWPRAARSNSTTTTSRP